jgi:glc operon protein GlcG
MPAEICWRLQGWMGPPCWPAPAIAKAATSASIGAATGEIPFEFGVNLSIASAGGIVNLGGGLPVVVNGELLGAIGVGSGTTEQDVAVAEAGRAALISALAAT